MKTLIYACVFFNKNYIHLLELFLDSMKRFGNLPDSADLLILTDPEFDTGVREAAARVGIRIHISHMAGFKTLFLAGCARMMIFDYPNINLYDKILYLDTDIIVSDSIGKMIDLDIEPAKIYALKEGTIEHVWWGGPTFYDFNVIDKNTPGFSTCVLFFRNSPEMRGFFKKLYEEIMRFVLSREMFPITLDQPFFIKIALLTGMYNNTLLQNLIKNHPESFEGQVISHFPIGPGDYTNKLFKMKVFYEYLRIRPVN